MRVSFLAILSQIPLVSVWCSLSHASQSCWVSNDIIGSLSAFFMNVLYQHARHRCREERNAPLKLEVERMYSRDANFTIIDGKQFCNAQWSFSTGCGRS